MKYLKYPHSIVALSEEIIRIANDYKAHKLENEDLKEIIQWYATHCGDKLFRGADDYNPTLKKIIGKQRIRLLDQILKESQLTFIKKVI